MKTRISVRILAGITDTTLRYKHFVVANSLPFFGKVRVKLNVNSIGKLGVAHSGFGSHSGNKSKSLPA